MRVVMAHDRSPQTTIVVNDPVIPPGFEFSTLYDFEGSKGDFWINDPASMVQDSAGSIPDVGDMDPFGNWLGQRGAQNLIQTSSSDKPYWSATLNCVVFPAGFKYFNGALADKYGDGEDIAIAIFCALSSPITDQSFWAPNFRMFRHPDFGAPLFNFALIPQMKGISAQPSSTECTSVSNESAQDDNSGGNGFGGPTGLVATDWRLSGGGRSGPADGPSGVNSVRQLRVGATKITPPTVTYSDDPAGSYALYGTRFDSTDWHVKAVFLRNRMWTDEEFANMLIGVSLLP